MGEADLWDEVRRDILGARATIATPFGERELLYADFTASGRAVGRIEAYIASVLDHYANTHTEDDATGRITTTRLHRAESTIKRLLNATPDHRLITVGAGTTAAVHRLQQILGIYIPPAAKEMLREEVERQLGVEAASEMLATAARHRPVVFVGPYEHHSNEVSWRECWADVVEVDLAPDGSIDLDDLRTRLADPAYAGRRKIGAFSAASNVSGVRTDVATVASILHEHDTLACFDFAAIAPYVRIDASDLDAVYFSPHKYLGGPGAAGVLLINRRIYREDLSPTVSAGGTVNFVDFTGQDYSDDIETREKAGTPGILQTMRASLAMELQDRLDPDRIAEREDELLHHAFEGLTHPAIEILGPHEPERRIAIVSFNIRAPESDAPEHTIPEIGPDPALTRTPRSTRAGAYLHPRFVTLLLNDLFGIQSRAGCSCAGPYGHRMLGLDELTSAALRDRVHKGVLGLRPGWVRVNFHYLMTDEECDYLISAIRFVADHGHEFLPLYAFDVCTGSWTLRRPLGAETAESDKTGTAHSGPDDDEGCLDFERDSRFGLDEAFALDGDSFLRATGKHASGARVDEAAVHEAYLREAERLLAEVRTEHPHPRLRSTLKDLIPFVYCAR
jgi:selenocysteine lyase/cysteine desulfurase